MTIRQHTHLRHPSWPAPPGPWDVITTAGTHQVMAVTAAAAILSGLELAGRGARLVRCVRVGEW
jgi:hypothetical protein